MSALAATVRELPRNGDGPDDLHLIDPNTIQVRDIEWMIEDFIQADTFNLVQGHGGANKGTFTCHLAALATSGKLSDDGEPMMVLFASAEDDHATVLVPRLMAAGADLDYVRFVPQMSLPADITNGKLQRAIRKERARLLFVDPIVTYLEKIDSHKDLEVKKALTPILELAQVERCTIVGVLHFGKDTTKGALFSGNGSGAFGNTARVVLAMVKDDEDDNLRIVEAVKSNGGIVGANALYRVKLVEVPPLKRPQVTLVHEGRSAKSADQALAATREHGRVNKESLQTLILEQLASGEKSREYLNQAAADEFGASSNTVYKQGLVPLKKAAKVLNYQTAAGWQWRLNDGG
jgi:hypothetical protein